MRPSLQVGLNDGLKMRQEYQAPLSAAIQKEYHRLIETINEVPKEFYTPDCFLIAIKGEVKGLRAFGGWS